MHQGDSSQKYYMPTTMDKGIVSLRKWLGSLAGPIPWGSPATPDIWAKQYPRDEILSRYNQHTQHCKHCSKVCVCLCLSVCLLFATQACLSFCPSVCPLYYCHNAMQSKEFLCLVPCACKVQYARLQLSQCNIVSCHARAGNLHSKIWHALRFLMLGTIVKLANACRF